MLLVDNADIQLARKQGACLVEGRWCSCWSERRAIDSSLGLHCRCWCMVLVCVGIFVVVVANGMKAVQTAN